MHPPKLGDVLEGVVENRVVFKAIDHVLSRVKSFNSSKYPLTIEYIGLGGSALSSKEIDDIDIVLGCSTRGEYANDWKEFKKLLFEKFNELWSFIVDISLFTRRATIDDVIEEYFDEIKDLGFKEWWINEWFKWLRISDFRWGVDRGVPIVYFSLRELVERYMKYGWKGKRLEIHIKIIDKDKYGVKDFMETKIPHIIVWRRTLGFVKPSNQELKEFFTKEYEELLNITLKIIKEEWTCLPPIYQEIRLALESNPPQPVTISEYEASCFKISKEIYNKAKDILKEKLKQLTTLTTVKLKEIEEYRTFNRNLRTTLKEILALAYITNLLSDEKTLTRIIAKTKQENIEEYLSKLKEYIIRSGPRQGFRRNTLRNILQTLMK